MADQSPNGGGADLSALQSQVEKLTSKLQNAEAEIVNYKKSYSWITDPEAVKAKLEDYDNLRKQSTGGDKTKIDQIISEKEKEIEGRFSKKLTEFENANQQISKELKTLRVTNVAMQEAAKIFNADGLPLLQAVIEQTTDFVDGKVVVMKDGKPAASEKDPRQPMGLPEYMEILAKQYPSLAKSQIVSGGKPSGTNMGTGHAVSASDFLKLPKAEQFKIMAAFPQTPDGQKQRAAYAKEISQAIAGAI